MAHRTDGKLVEVGTNQGVAGRVSRAAHHGHRIGLLRPGHHRRARLDDAGFFGSNPGNGRAEPSGVVEPDAAYDRDVRRINDVRGVEPAAQTYFQYHNLASDLGKVRKRYSGHQLELRGVVTGFHRYPLCMFAHLKRDAPQVVKRNVLPVNADALLEALNVGAGKPSRLIAGGLQDARKVSSRAALAVRAGDVHEAQRILRTAQALEQVANAVEPQTRGLPARVVDVGDRVERFGIERLAGGGSGCLFSHGNFLP